MLYQLSPEQQAEIDQRARDDARARLILARIGKTDSADLVEITEWLIRELDSLRDRIAALERSHGQ